LPFVAAKDRFGITLWVATFKFLEQLLLLLLLLLPPPPPPVLLLLLLLLARIPIGLSAWA